MARTDTRWYRHERWIATLARVVLFVGALWFLGAVLVRLSSVTVPLFGGFLLAFVSLPAIDALDRRMPRGLAVTLVAVLGLLAAAVLAFLVVPLFTRELAVVLRLLPEWVERVQTDWIPALIRTFDLEDAVEPGAIQQMIEQSAAPLIRNTGLALQSLTGFLARAVDAAIILVMVPIFAMFFGYHFHTVVAFGRSLVPPRHMDDTVRVLRDVDRTLAKWIRGQLTVCVALAVMYCIGLSLAGLKGAIAIGIVAGLLNFVPYLGTIAGSTMSFLMAALEGSPPETFVLIASTFAIAGLIEGWIITPRVVGGSVGLGGLGVLVALMVGAELMGMLGVLVAVPTAAVLVILLREARVAYSKSPFFTHP